MSGQDLIRARDMDERIRALDWSRTPLGTRERWPRTLRTLVDLLLSQPIPMIILWGPELTQIYNDAYAVIAGSKHPRALGQANRECWPEASSLTEPIYRRVLDRGERVLLEEQPIPLDRRGLGTLEDAYFTVSYSPALDDEGRVGGIFVTVVETTSRVLADRARERQQAAEALQASEEQVRLLKEAEAAVRASEARYRTLFEAIDEGFCVIEVLFDGEGRAIDYRLLETNPAFERQTGIRGAVGKRMREIAPAHEGRWFEIYGRVATTGESVRFEEAARALGRIYTVYAARVGDPRDHRVAVIFQDITAQRHAQDAERELRRKLDSALLAGEVGTFEWDIVEDRLWGDRNFVRLFGVESQAGGATPLAAYLAAIHPEDRERVGSLVRAAVETGAEYRAEYRITSSVPARWVIARGQVERDPDGRPLRFPGVVVDVTERKQVELLLAAQNEALELIASGAVLGAALEVLARAVEEQAGGDAVAAILLVDESDGCSLRTGAAPSLPPEYSAAIDGIKAERGVGTCADAAARNEVVVTPDLSAAPSWRGLSHLPLALGLKAAWSLPIRAANGRVLGTFGTYFRETRGPTDRERRIVEGLSRAAALAIERRSAEDALRASESRFRFLSDLNEATRDLPDAEDVMATAARMLGEHLGASRCAYAEVEADEEQFTIRHDFAAAGVPSTVGRYGLSLFGARAASEQRSGRTLVIDDVDRELTASDGADTFNAIGVKAIVCCPLVRSGRLVAMMAVHQVTPRGWTPAEVSLVEAVVERSWAYLERARAQRSLAEALERLELAVNAGELGTFYCPMPFGEIVWNETCNEHFFLAPGAKVDFERFYSILHPDDRTRTREAVEEAVSSRTGYDVQYRAVAPDGRQRWIRAKGRAYYDAAGMPTRFDGVTIDISEQKSAEAELARLLSAEQRARAEAEQAGRMKDEFLATLSHELRTPLNAILGWAQILQRSRSAEEIAEGLQVIQRNARAQTQIIEDLLDMSRIVSGKVRLDIRALDLSEVLSAAVKTVAPGAEAKGVRIETSLGRASCPVSGDPDRLQQIFWNLLSNAVKFTPRGGQVLVLSEQVGSHFEVRVVDTGEGIEPDFLPHVFDRFRQADGSTTRRHGGLGLGLSIVKQLVEVHGGSVRVTSGGKGFGSTFTVSLPLAVNHPAPEPGESDPLPTPRERSSDDAVTCPEIRGVRVLIVDDDSDARTLVRRSLEGRGAIVTTAGSASEAIESFETDRPDVLLCDIAMPGEDGYSLIRKVRARSPAEGGRVPAVALTAYARGEDRAKALRCGFEQHVVKPVEPEELVTVVALLAGRLGRS